MAATLEQLEARLNALEKEVAALRESVNGRVTEMSAIERGLKLLRDAKASQPALSEAVARTYEKMGIKGEPTMTIEELHAAMIADGVNPEDNAASREILAMREE